MSSLIEHNEIAELKQLVLTFHSDLKRHMEVEEIQGKNNINMILEMRNDIKELKDNHNQHITQVQDHIETKISVCNDKITTTLENQYMTKPAIEAYAGKIVTEQVKERNEAINGLRKRLEAEFDGKIANVKEKIKDAQIDVDEKIKATEGKARLIAWVAGTIMGAITTVIGLAIAISKLVV